MNLIITLFVATIGGFIGLKSKIPAGTLVFAMLAVAIYNIITDKAYIPSNLKFIAQVVVGGMIGLSFTKETFFNLKNLIVPSIILVVCLLTFSIVIGVIIHKFTNIDLITALFSSSPGGLTDMTLMSGEYGAVQSTVVTLHLMRLITVLIFLPRIIGFISKYLK